MAGTGVGKFSSTAGNNTANMTVNFAENMAPSNVNNAARELMGHMRDMYEQLGDGYFEFGDGDGTYTVARSDADTITITSSSDISSVYFAGRKIRITDGGANVVEGTIASSSHSSTTQTVNLTGISLASGTPTKVELGIDTAAFGGRVILDDDGDTYIEAPTDDTIDIYVAGAKDFVITANTFTAESGSTIAAQALTATGIDVTGAITATAASTITTADNTDTLTLTSTDADAAIGPNLRLYRNSSSPADDDLTATVDFEWRNDNSQDVIGFQIDNFCRDVSDGAEENIIRFKNMFNGTLTEFMRADSQSDQAVVTVNELSNDIDFRVESNNDTHMLFVDGGNDHVNIGTSSDLGGVLNVNGQTVITTADNTDTLTLISTDADANVGPQLVLHRDSASPANNDVIGRMRFEGEDNEGNKTVYAQFTSQIIDKGDSGGEDSTFQLEVFNNGAIRDILTVVGTTGGTPEVVFNDASQDVDFRVESNGNTHMLFVDGGNNRISMGDESPSNCGAIVTVSSGDSGATVNNTFDAFCIEGGGSRGMNILTPNNASGGIVFGDPEDNDSGRFIYDHDNDRMFFMTSGTEHFRIANNGDLTATDTSIGSLSDQRLKKDISNFSYDISKFKQLQPRSFEWKNKSEHGNKTGLRGFVAQEVDAVDNHFVNSETIKEDYQPLDFALLDDAGLNNPRSTYTSKLGDKDAMYISVIQQLITRIEALEA